MTDEETLAEGAKHFPTSMLKEMFVEKMDLGLEIENTGPLKVAVIIGRELERRGELTAGQIDFIEGMEVVIKFSELKYKGKPNDT
jgi:hypothetical protein